MSSQRDDGFERHSVGQSIPRGGDGRLLRGEGRFTDDIDLPGQAHAVVFRSPHAHARILNLDVQPALEAPGVLAVLTAADVDAAGLGTLPCGMNLPNRDGSAMRKPPRPVLATDRVRHVGEAVALVVAETRGQARDAAELIGLDVEPLPAVTDARAALGEGAPQLHEEAPGNLSLDWEFGDADAVADAFRSAHHVESMRLRSNRVVVCAMESRAAVAEYDPERDRYTLCAPSQGVFGMRNALAETLMKVKRDQVRLLTHDVGGSFGMKSPPYPEYPPLLLAARRLRRPVKWCDDRSESFLSDQHGRDSVAEAALAFDAEGRLLAGRVVCHANLGAYLTSVGPSMHTRNLPRNFPGPYRLPLLHTRTLAAFTNTTPIGAYRGAGRPEGVYYMERLMDGAARAMGMDPVELRRRNLIPPQALPYTAVSELSYDSGDFPAILARGAELADREGFEDRRARSQERGLLRGLGIACYLEVTGPPATEMGGIRFREDGRVLMVSGSLDYGQGHGVTFAQIVSDRLGIPLEALDLLQGDSEALIAGSGTGGSRTTIGAGTLIFNAAEEVIARGRRLAAAHFEAAEPDVAFGDGRFGIPGTDRSVDLRELARLAPALAASAPADDPLPDSLDVAIAETTPPSAFPNGCHVAEVEVDPATGVTRLASYRVVDDFGTLINPMLVEGQVHGGVAQGVGQALMENAVYDDEGQLLSGSYMDYALPRADDLPTFEFSSRPVPATTNPLGVKGCGEAGTTGALPAIMNAIVDALGRETGRFELDMPATPERIWRALRDGGDGVGGGPARAAA